MGGARTIYFWEKVSLSQKVVELKKVKDKQKRGREKKKEKEGEKNLERQGAENASLFVNLRHAYLRQ